MYLVSLQSNRATLKMDVSHTDHSHVIGKGGNNIKRVMQETGCHIHFPDSNRGSNVQEKSNQVKTFYFLTLLLLNTTCPVLANSVNPDHFISSEAS